MCSLMQLRVCVVSLFPSASSFCKIGCPTIYCFMIMFPVQMTIFGYTWVYCTLFSDKLIWRISALMFLAPTSALSHRVLHKTPTCCLPGKDHPSEAVGGTLWSGPVAHRERPVQPWPKEQAIENLSVTWHHPSVDGKYKWMKIGRIHNHTNQNRSRNQIGFPNPRMTHEHILEKLLWAQTIQSKGNSEFRDKRIISVVKMEERRRKTIIIAGWWFEPSEKY